MEERAVLLSKEHAVGVIIQQPITLSSNELEGRKKEGRGGTNELAGGGGIGGTLRVKLPLTAAGFSGFPGVGSPHTRPRAALKENGIFFKPMKL
jgi:hypothetical protein